MNKKISLWWFIGLTVIFLYLLSEVNRLSKFAAVQVKFNDIHAQQIDALVQLDSVRALDYNLKIRRASRGIYE